MGAANQMRFWSRALIGISHELDLDSGQKLSILPSVDDGCTFNIGDGTQDIDVKLFAGLSAFNMLFDVGNSRVEVGTTAAGEGMDVRMFGETAGSLLHWDLSADTLILNASKLGEYRMRAPETHASNYTLVAADSGKIFCSTAAFTFTLPAVSLTGFHAWFHVGADENLVIASASANEMILDNTLVGESVTFGTTTEQIGQALYVISDGAKWFCFMMLAQTLFGITIAA